MKTRWLGNAYILALSLALFFLPGSAAAQNTVATIATAESIVNTGNGGTAVGEEVCGSCSPGDSFQWVAAQFTLTQPAALTTVQGWFGSTDGTFGPLNLVVRTNNAQGEYPLPGAAIWSQSYTVAAQTTNKFVTFSNYNPVLAAGTYWICFEPPKGSALLVPMSADGATPLTPASRYAFYNAPNGHYDNFAEFGNTDYPSLTISGLALTTSTGAGVITFGTAADTVTSGTVFNMFPFSQGPVPVGDVGQSDTLQWNIYSPAAVASADGVISANPSVQGNIITAGAYSATGTTASGAARGVAFATYVNLTGTEYDEMNVNAVLDGNTLGYGAGYPVQVQATVYVFDTAPFTTALNNAASNGFTAAQFLLGAGPNGVGLEAGYGANGLKDLSVLFPSGTLVDSSISGTSYPVVCPGLVCTNDPLPYSVPTAGFNLPAYGIFTVMFDVSAASIGSASAQSIGVADFLDTLMPDLVNGFFLDSGGDPIPSTVIAGPVAVVLPDTPATITLTPATATVPIGSTATVTALVEDATGNPIPNAVVRFFINSGPHMALGAPAGTPVGIPVGTDSNGKATFTLTDTLGNAATTAADSISASIGGVTSSSPAQISWSSPGPLFSLTLSPNPATISPGGSQPYTAAGFDAFSNPLGDETANTTFTITSPGSCSGTACGATTPGPYTVTGTDGQYQVAGANAGPITGTATLNVTSSSLTTPTITFGAAPSATYLGGNFTVSATTNSNGALTYSYVSGPCIQVSGGTFNSTGAGMCVVQANTAATSTYSAGSAQQSVTISPATTTVNFGTAPTPTYQGGNFTVSASTNSTGTLTYSYVSGPCAFVSGASFSSSGAGPCVVQASVAATTNYTAGSAQQSVTISPATTTVNFGTAPTPTYQGGNFTVSASTNSTGTLTYSYVSGPCAFVSGASFSSSGAGPCVVQASVAATTNYTAGSAQQTVTIKAATPTITFGAAPSATYPGSNFTVSATTNSNGALSYSYVSGPCTLVSGGTFSPTGVGSCVVKASTALTTNFLAGSANQSVTIAAAGQTPTFTITPNPAAETVTRGVVGGFILKLQSVDGFDANVKLTCSGGPAGSYCVDFPMTVKVNGTDYAVSGILFPKNSTPGTYVITFTGVSGSQTVKSTATFTVK